MRERASEDVTLAAWDELKAAIQKVECSLPFQMSEAIGQLIVERRAFEQIMLRRGVTPTPAQTGGDASQEPKPDRSERSAISPCFPPTKAEGVEG